ncbi:alpha/beta fold hydrolase [Halobacillus locisalis]|uniref:Proline iminopeptidase n=1 Tax=Halobacillus locisalis TaxID=220753 RepID=A0A838CWK5_9BACI|nr:alpha/beta fold hydrolase [Halobacillus locisalis]
MKEHHKLSGGDRIKSEEGFIEKHNYRTYYEVHTPRGNPYDSTPIILLAGGPGLSFTSLTPLLQLAEERKVIAYDQLGSGKSTRSESFRSLHIEDFIEQFNAIVTEMDLKKFHLLGHSWGTVLGVNIALQYPKETQSLILHSGIADWKKCLEERVKFEEKHSPDELKQIMKKERDGIPTSTVERDRLLKAFNSHFYCRVEYPDYLKQSLEDKDIGTNQLIWNPEKNEAMATYNICDRLHEIKCPALIVSGKFDGISVGQASLFKSGIKDSTHVEFQNSSHYSHIEEESRFLECVRDFLNDVEYYRGDTK